MNEKIPVSNETDMPMYVAGCMIPPGETRHFDIDQVPPHLRPAAPADLPDEPQADVIAELAEQTVKDIVAALPTLSDEYLDRLGEIEQMKGDHARTTLLAAISEAQLSRAEAAQG